MSIEIRVVSLPQRCQIHLEIATMHHHHSEQIHETRSAHFKRRSHRQNITTADNQRPARFTRIPIRSYDIIRLMRIKFAFLDCGFSNHHSTLTVQLSDTGKSRKAETEKTIRLSDIFAVFVENRNFVHPRVSSTPLYSAVNTFARRSSSS